MPYFGMNTPRICFLKTLRKVLEDMPDTIWNFKKDTVERELGDRLDLSPDNGDDEVGNEMGPVDD